MGNTDRKHSSQRFSEKCIAIFQRESTEMLPVDFTEHFSQLHKVCSVEVRPLVMSRQYGCITVQAKSQYYVVTFSQSRKMSQLRKRALFICKYKIKAGWHDSFPILCWFRNMLH